MKEAVLLKFDDNFDGKINLEEVCSLTQTLYGGFDLSRILELSRRFIKHIRDINSIYRINSIICSRK